jgi:hypothetical protein
VGEEEEGGRGQWTFLLASAGHQSHDLVACIDLGPGSNQPLHHLQTAAQSRRAKGSRAVLR